MESEFQVFQDEKNCEGDLALVAHTCVLPSTQEAGISGIVIQDQL
jgi:hypothetical protein